MKRTDDGQLALDILRNAAEAVVFADTGGVIRAWNPGAEAVFGYTSAEAMGQSLDLIIPEHLRAAHWKAFDRALTEGATRLGRVSMVTRSLSKGGGKLYVDMTFAVVRNEAGEVVGSVAVARDVTARFMEERRMKQRLAELDGSTSLTNRAPTAR